VKFAERVILPRKNADLLGQVPFFPGRMALLIIISYSSREEARFVGTSAILPGKNAPSQEKERVCRGEKGPFSSTRTFLPGKNT